MADDIDVPARCNCARIRRAARSITRYYDTKLAPSGLGANQFTLLGYLKRRGPMRIVQLADLLAMDRATLGHNLRPLERDGLLETKPDKNDGRARLVSITAAGREKMALARPYWDEAQDRFEASFGAPEAMAMRGIMDSVADLQLSSDPT